MNYISEGSVVYYVPVVADCALRLPWHEFDSGDVFIMHNEAEKTHEYEFPVLNLEDKVLLELARNRNKIPLPKSIAGSGVPLPPQQDTLINPNYQLAIAKKQTSQPEETEEDEESADPNPAPSKNPSLSHEKTDVPQGTPQRVSFPLGAKRPR
ncbi:hypothetical protein MTR67_016799 [Solanum verrucosum]|uniref:Uncharacterized protein n=1 Tax=Solanum verrucosum TaxID=315347 RepID=A0AAF0QGP2_SOLVR|nr:hypothetical protein MTR67_016799 [Solanum verrucosum]